MFYSALFSWFSTQTHNVVLIINFFFLLLLSLQIQAVKSPNLDYSHFISLPLAIHPELVNKLLNFQNSILGNSDGCPDENWDSDSNEDATDNEVGHRQLDKQPDVAVELKTDDDNEHVKVNRSKIPLVSYAPTASKSSPLSGMPTIILHDSQGA